MFNKVYEVWLRGAKEKIGYTVGYERTKGWFSKEIERWYMGTGNVHSTTDLTTVKIFHTKGDAMRYLVDAYYTLDVTP